MAIPAAKPGLSEAVELTKEVITRRAAQHRNLVVAVVLVTAAPLVAALCLFDAGPLLALLALLPLCWLYAYRDVCRVHRWRRDVLGIWVANRMSLDHFVQTCQALRFLPPETLGGMLDTLPRGTASVPPALRQPVALTAQFIHATAADRTLVAAIVGSVAVAMVGVALAMWSWLPLVGIAGVALRPLFWRALYRFRLHAWQRGLRACLDQPPSDEALQTLPEFGWHTLPPAAKACWFRILAPESGAIPE